MQRWWWIVVAVVAVACVGPLTASFLPFCDFDGHVGLAAALARWSDPASRIPEHYAVNGGILPSNLFEYLGATVGRVVGVVPYANGFIAVFWVLGFPAALACLLRAWGRDARLAVLVMPFLYNRLLWFGFVNYLAGLSFMLFALALVRLAMEPGRKPRQLGLLAVAIAFTTIAAVMAHFFAAMLLLLCAVGLCVFLRPGWRAMVAVGAGLAPGALLVIRWLAGGVTRPKQESGIWTAIRTQDIQVKAKLLHWFDWAFNGLASRIDSVLGAVALVGLVAILALRVRGGGRREPLGSVVAPFLLLGGAIAGFFVLPMTIKQPYWWAVDVRFIPLVVAFAVLAFAPAPGRIRAWLLTPALAVSLVMGGLLTWDFHRWYGGVEMAGLEQVIEPIPPGSKVLMLFPPFEKEAHYAHFPMAFAGSRVVVRRGGIVMPMMDGEPRHLAIHPRPLPARPPWGFAHRFVWRQHGGGWQYFILKRPPTGPPPRNPFDGAPVELLASHGLWSLYRPLATGGGR